MKVGSVVRNHEARIIEVDFEDGVVWWFDYGDQGFPLDDSEVQVVPPPPNPRYVSYKSEWGIQFLTSLLDDPPSHLIATWILI